MTKTYKDNEKKFLTDLVPIFRSIMGNFFIELGEEDTGYKLIQAPFDHKAPEDEAYGTIQLLHSTKLSPVYKGRVTDYGQIHQQDVEISVRVTTFGEDAVTALERLEFGIEMTSTTDKLANKGIGWVGNSRTLDLTKLVSNHHQEQATLDIRLSTRFEWIDRLIVPIESVGITLEIEDKEPPIELNIT